MDKTIYPNTSQFFLNPKAKEFIPIQNKKVTCLACGSHIYESDRKYHKNQHMCEWKNEEDKLKKELEKLVKISSEIDRIIKNKVKEIKSISHRLPYAESGVKMFE